MVKVLLICVIIPGTRYDVTGYGPPWISTKTARPRGYQDRDEPLGTGPSDRTRHDTVSAGVGGRTDRLRGGMPVPAADGRIAPYAALRIARPNGGAARDARTLRSFGRGYRPRLSVYAHRPYRRKGLRPGLR